MLRSYLIRKSMWAELRILQHVLGLDDSRVQCHPTRFCAVLLAKHNVSHNALVTVCADEDVGHEHITIGEGYSRSGRTSRSLPY